MVRTAGYRYSCPGNRILSGAVEGVWCADLPCHGHLATRDQVLIAKTMAWADGLTWDDDSALHRVYLTSARQAMADMGLAVGRAR